MPRPMVGYWLLLLRLSALLAASFSCALLLHYLSPNEQAFCGAESDCELVRKSALAALGPRGLLPGVGIVGFVGLFWLTFQPGLRRLIAPSALFCAAISVALFAYQAFGLQAFCWLCVTVEALGLLVAASALMWQRASGATPVVQWDNLHGWVWLVLLGLSVNAPNLWLVVRARETLPAAIQQFQRADTLTIVEFTDFECPHCRRMHASLRTALDVTPSPHQVVRFQVPLKSHIHAELAARAAICAETFGHGEAMANRLFSGNIEPNALFAHAAALGLADASFRACLQAPTTSDTLIQHRTLFHSADGSGVPLTFIGTERVDGATSPNVVARLIEKATHSPRFNGLSPLQFAAATIVAVFAVVAVGRRKSAL